MSNYIKKGEIMQSFKYVYFQNKKAGKYVLTSLLILYVRASAIRRIAIAYQTAGPALCLPIDPHPAAPLWRATHPAGSRCATFEQPKARRLNCSRPPCFILILFYIINFKIKAYSFLDLNFPMMKRIKKTET